ncbi:MAG TPA: acetyl-CoA carboxylase biotin carboxyl carrier protein subunit [Bacteroidota bacterium]|nr:acetyl-CoA carboxylase biotin carboxyl carrier protein subunit [Bacteroidota bacterium]
METKEQIFELEIGGTAYETRGTDKFSRRKVYRAPDPHAIRCVIPGVIRSIAVRRGARVRAGEPLLVLEAMKMENDIVAPRDGIVRAVNVSPGDTVAKGAILVELE